MKICMKTMYKTIERKHTCFTHVSMLNQWTPKKTQLSHDHKKVRKRRDGFFFTVSFPLFVTCEIFVDFAFGRRFRTFDC